MKELGGKWMQGEDGNWYFITLSTGTAAEVGAGVGSEETHNRATHSADLDGESLTDFVMGMVQEAHDEGFERGVRSAELKRRAKGILAARKFADPDELWVPLSEVRKVLIESFGTKP